LFIILFFSDVGFFRKKKSHPAGWLTSTLLWVPGGSFKRVQQAFSRPAVSC
jgi:hypothetical protein